MNMKDYSKKIESYLKYWDVNKYMKDYGKNKETSYLEYWDINNLYEWAMSQKLPCGNFLWVEYRSQFNKDLVKKNNHTDIGYFLEHDVQYSEELHEFHNGL